MANDFDIFGLGKLIGLSRREPIEGTRFFKPGKVELAEFRTAGFSITTPHTPKDGLNIARIMRLDAEEAATGNFELHRRELVVLQLIGTLNQINDNYADHISNPKKIAEWNQRIGDFVITAYGQFTDYLQGKKFSNTLNKWLQIDPPHPQQAALVASDISKGLSTLTAAPFSKLLTQENRGTFQELMGHLQPYLAADIRPPSHDHK